MLVGLGDDVKVDVTVTVGVADPPPVFGMIRSGRSICAPRASDRIKGSTKAIRHTASMASSNRWFFAFFTSAVPFNNSRIVEAPRRDPHCCAGRTFK